MSRSSGGAAVRRPKTRGPMLTRKAAAKAGLPGRSSPTSSPMARRGRASSALDMDIVVYHPAKGVDDLVRQVSRATPMQLVEIERRGVAGRFVKDLAKRMDVSAVRVFHMLGVPKATVEKKSSTGDVVSGSGGQAAIGVARLIGIAQEIAANSTAKEARDLDAAKWLGQWLERPQPSLGGRKPADLIDTPTGVEVVARLLGAIESGAYQ